MGLADIVSDGGCYCRDSGGSHADSREDKLSHSSLPGRIIHFVDSLGFGVEHASLSL